MLVIDKKTFDEEVLGAEGYTLVDFWSLKLNSTER